MSADSAMKCTPQKTMYSASRPGGRVAGELERVPGDVGEPDDLVALVVVAEDEGPVAERRPGRAARRTSEGSDGGGQLARAGHAALAAGSAAAPSTSSGSDGGARGAAPGR